MKLIPFKDVIGFMTLDSIVVIGAGFGDEGKGMMCNYLHQLHFHKGSRFNGGQQAGHNVCYSKDISHIHASIPVGSDKSPAFWPKTCTLDPIAFMNEFNTFSKNVADKINMYVDFDTPIVTPYDVFYNRNSSMYIKHGTVGAGFGTTLEREDKHYKLHYHDLFNDFLLKEKYQAIKEYYKKFAPFFSESEAFDDKFFSSCTALKFILNPPSNLQPNNVYSCVFEGSQGLLLDQDYGVFPNVTRSNTGTKGLVNAYGEDILTSCELGRVYMHRIYSTRHGNGPFWDTNNKLHDFNVDLSTETNTTNKYQGTFRVSYLDLDLLIHAIQYDMNMFELSHNYICLTCLDQIPDLNKIIVSYEGRVQKLSIEDIVYILACNKLTVLVNDSNLGNVQFVKR